MQKYLQCIKNKKINDHTTHKVNYIKYKYLKKINSENKCKKDLEPETKNLFNIKVKGGIVHGATDSHYLFSYFFKFFFL